MTRNIRIALLSTLLLGVATSAQAALLQFYTTLAPEALGATGSGSALVNWDNSAHTYTVKANFSGLSGITTVAHIHCCVAVPGTGTASVASYPGTFPGFPAGVSSGSYITPAPIDLTLNTSFTAGFLTTGGGTAAGAEAALLAGILDGRAYFNVHSSTFPSGEIRGFLAPVPEPASIAIFGVGLAALGVMRRRRKPAAQSA